MPVGKPVSEKQFQAQVVELARISGWLTYHTFDSRRSAPGFPDLVLVRPPRLIFAELKSEVGKFRPEQRVWLEVLKGCQRVEARLRRPEDWRAIETLLCRRERRP
jgi:VRR-NUC domain